MQKPFKAKKFVTFQSLEDPVTIDFHAIIRSISFQTINWILFNYFFKIFCFVLGYSQLTNNVVVISGERQRDSTIHIHVSFLTQIALPSRLPHHIDQSFVSNYLIFFPALTLF